MAPPILLLPSEVLFLIVSFLDVYEVARLRQTSTQFAAITQDKSIWTAFFQLQKQVLPLPLNLLGPAAPSLDKLLAIEIESRVISSQRIATAWSRLRQGGLTKLQPNSRGSALLGLRIFLDRWLLSICVEGVVSLWDLEIEDIPYPASVIGTDLSSKKPAIQCASLDLGSKRWTSFSTALEPGGSSIILAMSSGILPTTTHIYRVELRRISSPDQFALLHTISNPAGAYIVRAIEPTLGLLVSSSSTANSMEVIRWPTSSHGNLDDWVMNISLQTDDLEEVWNGIISIQVVNPYVLIFRSRSVELYPLVPTIVGVRSHSSALPATLAAPLSHLPRLIHRFTVTTFHDTSYSNLISSPADDSENVMSLSICVLAYDVLQGIFKYNIRVCYSQIPLSGFPASLDVDCIGVYAMANNIDLGAILPMPRPTLTNAAPMSPIMTGDSPAPTPLPTPTPTPTNTSAHGSHSALFGVASVRRGTNVSSHGFISTIALGLQAKRAVWVERKRGAMRREIFVWSADREFDDEEALDEKVRMSGQLVYTLDSYDLRDDLTHCAIGETNGLIVLGNRAGDIYRLGLN